MIGKFTDWLRLHEKIALFFLALVFILIRLPGTDLPLHQDEYKWPEIVNPNQVSTIEVPHPPLTQFIFRMGGEIVGYNVNFRFIPLFFGTINLLLLWYFLKKKFDVRTAFVAGVFFALSYFSVLASLMVDTDGQIIPFFFLCALIAYDKIKSEVGTERLLWVGGFLLALVLGFFIKVSFFLVIAAIAADFLWEKKTYITKKIAFQYIGFGLGGIGILALLLVLSQYIFSFFNLSYALTYWKHFAQTDRNWFQSAIQIVKALLYTSPFFVLTPFFIEREDLKKLRVFLFYILFGMFFYTILFDFSIGALDRYLQFLIIPLCVLSAVALVKVLQVGDGKRNKEHLLLGSVCALILVCLLFIPHFVPSLHPKSAWISRIVSLRWNFLYPFSGGSGPLGFYVSFLFMAGVWIVSFILLLVGKFKPSLRKMSLLLLVSVGFVYNGVFAEEYLFGNLYGSAPRLVLPAVEFIRNNPEIEHVTVYNDNGGDEIKTTGKYERRLYIDPKFEVNIQEKIDYFNTHKEHYFVLNVPRFEKTTLYQRYFDTCEIVYNQIDKAMSAIVYDCRKVPNITE